MAEDKARDRRESLDSGRERNAVVRSQGPDVTRMDFFNGLLGRGYGLIQRLQETVDPGWKWMVKWIRLAFLQSP